MYVYDFVIVIIYDLIRSVWMSVVMSKLFQLCRCKLHKCPMKHYLCGFILNVVGYLVWSDKSNIYNRRGHFVPKCIFLYTVPAK